jgi:plasmid stabilization system protein ParE
MAFRVEIEPQAFEDLDSIALYIKTKSSLAIAERWFNAIIDSMRSLQEMPSRCPIAPESEDLDAEIRLLLDGRKNRAYKIYFAIELETSSSGVVRIFHVRHWARRAASLNELQQLMDELTAEE